jgi:hypothetical protein
MVLSVQTKIILAIVLMTMVRGDKNHFKVKKGRNV